MKALRRLLVAALIIIPIIFIGNSGFLPSLTSQKKPDTPVQLNYLTGLPGSNDFLLAVKIDDTEAAHPQIGVQDADIVYVEQVESGLTRLLAIFSCVRSARARAHAHAHARAKQARTCTS